MNQSNNYKSLQAARFDTELYFDIIRLNILNRALHMCLEKNLYLFPKAGDFVFFPVKYNTIQLQISHNRLCLFTGYHHFIIVALKLTLTK